MTIQQLEYILEVNRSGSVSRAAKKLFLSHSSVSNAVSALESELGFAIFERSHQGVTPTTRGRKVLVHAAQVCENLRCMREERTRIGNTIRIDTSKYLPCSSALLRLLEENRNREDVVFRHEFTLAWIPSLNKLAGFDTDLVVFASMGNSMYDFGLLARARNLEWKQLALVPVVLRIGPGHRLYHEPNLTPRSFVDDVFVDTPSANLSKSRMLQPLVDFDRSRVLRVADRDTQYALISKGFGFGVGFILPKQVDQQYGFRNILIPELQGHIVYAYNPAHPMAPELQRYLTLLEEELAPLRIE